MPGFRIFSAVEQVAKHLEERLAQGEWAGGFPGARRLAEELGVNHKTVTAAMQQLEQQGLIERRGERLRRRALPEAVSPTRQSLRLAILPWRRHGSAIPYMIELQHKLIEAGHQVVLAERGLMELGMDLGRVRRQVSRTEADAWLVVAAPQEIFEWFAAQPFPVFGFHGSFGGLPIAATGPDFGNGLREVADMLVGLGHRRIVMLGRPQRRLPRPQYPETCFLDALDAHGITTGDYNFPLWEDNLMKGLHGCLNSLFGATPPTALVMQEAKIFAAVQQFLALRGLKVPGDVSLVCCEGDPTFEWQIPSVAHFEWDSAPWIRRAVRWADNIAQGKDDRRQYLPKVRFVPGGTLGPVPKAR